MPLYYYRCCKCGQSQRKIQAPEEAVKLQECSRDIPGKGPCGYVLQREPRPPSTQVMETLDNGVMTKRLERLADAERLFKERNEAVKKSQGI